MNLTLDLGDLANTASAAGRSNRNGGRETPGMDAAGWFSHSGNSPRAGAGSALPAHARFRRRSGSGRRLAAKSIQQLYTHQAEAVEHALAGRNVVVVTPTASGKTLCYNLPVLQTLLADPTARAFYLFPTKALAEDQRHELDSLVTQLPGGVTCHTYDGDTPQDARRAIRERANIVLTNPDMLHTGILPHHTKWAKCFENLRYFVIDELHFYRGVYGSHLANIIHRLRRICNFYGSNPTFICSSATISNPKQLAEDITGQTFELVDNNGAPSGEKYFIFYNPPVVNRQLGIRRSYLHETRRHGARIHPAASADTGLHQQPPGHRSAGDLPEGCLLRAAVLA